MKKLKKRLPIMFGALILVIVYFGVLQFQISKFSNITAPQNADYLIVLGAKVNGTVPSLALNERIKTAAAYLLNNKNTIAIASGGKGPGEDISEAEAIKQELVKYGVSDSRIFLEDRSTDTYENVQFSKGFIPQKAIHGIIVTNNFHVFRSIRIAKDHGLVVTGLPAKTPKTAIVKSYVREYLAITKYFLKSVIN
jgi:uncharacterized SAM-binding protein YcdF (DUF218 family)